MVFDTPVMGLAALLLLSAACSNGSNGPDIADVPGALDDTAGDTRDIPHADQLDVPSWLLPHGQVLLPAGAFFMGAHSWEACVSQGETPRHYVTLTHPLVVLDHEVTAGEWLELTGLPVPGLPTGANEQYFCTDSDCPAAYVNWFEAAWYANLLSERDGLVPCYEMVDCTGTFGSGCKEFGMCEGDYRCASVDWPDAYCTGWRLPTEAEWEYLARGGTDGAFSFPYPEGGLKNGNCTQCELEEDLEYAGWYCGNSGVLAHPVRQLIPNAALVYDASGNVYEWCFDWQGDYPDHDVVDPAGPSSGQQKVARGGSFLDNPRHCRLAYRNGYPPAMRSRNLGLRLLRQAEPGPDTPQATAPTDRTRHDGPNASHRPVGLTRDPLPLTPDPTSPRLRRAGLLPLTPAPQPPTPDPVPCTPADGCGEGDGMYCGKDGMCVACDNALHCGPDCLVCTFPTPVCVGGMCAECPDDGYCPVGKWCESGACVACTADDPAHCGPTCQKCAGSAPACIKGHCRCTGDSCGPWQVCDEGKCALCNVPERCGETCQPCPEELPFCRFDALGCVECLVDADCGPGMACQDNVCVPDCKAQGCHGVPPVPGGDCENPRTAGRVPLNKGIVLAGNSATAANGDPPGGEADGCPDAAQEQFVTVFLTTGDTLSVELMPMDPLFDATLKLRSGKGCVEGEVPLLLACSAGGGDRKPESLEVTAQSDAWVTVVVDGAETGKGPHDFGFYLLKLDLECAREGCCCL